MKKKLNKQMEELLSELALLQVKELTKLVKDGEATAGHFAVIRGLLRDNNIQIKSDSEDSPMAELIGELNANFDEYDY